MKIGRVGGRVADPSVRGEVTPSDFLPDDITVFQEPIYDISKCNRSVEEIFMLLKKLCNVITRVIFCNTT